MLKLKLSLVSLLPLLPSRDFSVLLERYITQKDVGLGDTKFEQLMFIRSN